MIEPHLRILLRSLIRLQRMNDRAEATLTWFVADPVGICRRKPRFMVDRAVLEESATGA